MTRSVWIFRRGPMMAVALLVIGIIVVTTGAQDAGAPASEGGGIDARTGALPTFEQLFMFSPYINGAIGVLSVIALGLFVWYLLTINSRAMVPVDFVDELNKLVIRGKYDVAADLCRANRKIFVASVVQRCLDNAGKGHSVILDMIDTEGRRRADTIWNRISYLADVSNVAPMLGLLGTVLGMIKAFFLLQGQTASVNAMALSRGVGEAMSTTMFGLAVGIIALVFYSIVKSRVTRTLAEAEAAVHMIVDHVKRNDE